MWIQLSNVNAGISSSEKTFEGRYEGGEAKKAREPFPGKEGSAPSGLMTVGFSNPSPPKLLLGS